MSTKDINAISTRLEQKLTNTLLGNGLGCLGQSAKFRCGRLRRFADLAQTGPERTNGVEAAHIKHSNVF